MKKIKIITPNCAESFSAICGAPSRPCCRYKDISIFLKTEIFYLKKVIAVYSGLQSLRLSTDNEQNLYNLAHCFIGGTAVPT